MLESAPPTVLLASADAAWRMACSERLLNSGCDVHTAINGYRAMDDLRKHQYDLIVFDDSMPDFSILELHLNVCDLARNAPRQIIATVNGGQKVRERIRRGSDVELASPQEILDRLVPEIERVRSDRN